MKRVILCAGLMCSIAISASAQNSQRKKQADAKDKAAGSVQPPAVRVPAATPDNPVRTLTSTADYRAYGAARGSGGLQISDPTLRALNARAAGANIPVSGSGIIGMPKGSYGYKNGQFLFRSAGAPTMGTATGSGAVGTGTSMLGMGASSATFGVNGKSPYAGPGMWGSGPFRPELLPRDTSTRQ